MKDKRVFFQGDRDISGEARETAIKIMRGLGKLGWKANVGAYGALVAAICKTGVSVRGHGFGAKDQPEQIDRDKFEFVDCSSAKIEGLSIDSASRNIKLYPNYQPYTWAIRLAMLMETSNAFIFFPGRQGTLAHLIPILAFNIKGKEKPKKVALVGWNRIISGMLLLLVGIDKEMTPWFGIFNLDEVDQVVEFLNEDLLDS